MKLLVLSCLLLPGVLATSIGSTSVVITSHEVHYGLANLDSLTPGEEYRVYAVFASNHDIINTPYPRNIIIKGDPIEFTQFTVAELAVPKPFTGGLVLDDSKILLAPITIVDANPYDTEFVQRIPFTIYIVFKNGNISPSPVISASHFIGGVDTGMANDPTDRCTILSAEPAIQLSRIETRVPSSPIEVWTAGYDADSSYNVLTVLNTGSAITIGGPIVTLFNTDGNWMDFRFNIRRDRSAMLDPLPLFVNLDVGSPTTFLSQGYLNETDSYNIDYNHYFYRFGADLPREAEISVKYSIEEDASVDQFQLECSSSTQSSFMYFNLAKAGRFDNIWCNHLEFYVYPENSTVRYKIDVQSSSSSTSILALFIVSVLGAVHY